MKSETRRRRLYKSDSVTMMLSEMGYTEKRCLNCRSFVIEEEDEEDDFEKTDSTGWCKANRVWLQVDEEGNGCCEIHIEKPLVVKNFPEEEGDRMKSEKDKNGTAITTVTTQCPDLSPPGMEATEGKSCEYCEKPIGAGHVSRDGFDFCSAKCSEQSRDLDTCEYCGKSIDGEPIIFRSPGYAPLFFCSVTCQQKSAGAKQ